jgi:hypothetical protein
VNSRHEPDHLGNEEAKWTVPYDESLASAAANRPKTLAVDRTRFKSGLMREDEVLSIHVLDHVPCCTYIHSP